MWAAPIAGVIALGCAIVVVALWQAPRGPDDPRAREARWAFVAAALTLPLGPAILLHANRRLPAEPPDHWQESIWSVWTGTAGDTWYAVAAILLLLRLTIPALAWYAAARLPMPVYAPRRRERAPLLVALAMVVLSIGVATARVRDGGVSAETFTELGHLTPGPATGPAVGATIEQHAVAGSLARPAIEVLPAYAAPPPEPPPRSPLERNRFDWSFGFTFCFYACDPPEAPPSYLAGWQSWRPARDGQVVLLRSEGDRVAAMLVEDVSLEPIALDVRDVWRLVRPPMWPLALALAIAGAGVWLGVRTRRRLTATWLFLEATTLVVFAFATYAGM